MDPYSIIDSKEYVVVGTHEYNIILPSDTYRNWVIFFIVLLLLLAIALIVWMLLRPATTNVFSGQPLQTATLANIETINTLQGAVPVGSSYYGPNDAEAFRDATSCNANATSVWVPNISKCQCDQPIWGYSCNRNSYDQKYISAGNYDSSLMNIVPLALPSSKTLFECTALCDSTSGCNGVVWQPTNVIDGICTPISEVIVNQYRTIPYPLGVDSTIYMNQSNLDSIVYTDRLWLYTGALPLRYWLKDTVISPVSNLQTIATNIVYLLPFYPVNSLNQTHLIGVYSLLPFTTADYNTLLLGGDTETVYIDHGGVLNVPLGWQYQNIWVMYQ